MAKLSKGSRPAVVRSVATYQAFIKLAKVHVARADQTHWRLISPAVGKGRVQKHSSTLRWIGKVGLNYSWRAAPLRVRRSPNFASHRSLLVSTTRTLHPAKRALSQHAEHRWMLFRSRTVAEGFQAQRGLGFSQHRRPSSSLRTSSDWMSLI